MAYLVFHPVIVDGPAPSSIARRCFPAFKAVIQGFGRAGAIRHFLPMSQHPLMQSISNGPSFFISYDLSFIG
jgi:hypothetical protein